MTNAATDDYDSLHDLSPRHLAALDALDSGATHEQAAEAADVHRVTVTRWTTKHPAFIAERNRRANERARLVAGRIESVTSRAIEVVGAAIDGGDLSAAFTWLKQAGISAQETSRLTDSSAVLNALADRAESDQLLSMLSDRILLAAEASLRVEFDDDEAWLEASAQG